MPSKDLNIIQRGQSFGWSVCDCIKASDLTKVSEMKTDNGKALNAIPSPFARFYVVKEAFRRVLEEKQNDSPAGNAYKLLVSNCLDIFEILYNKQYFESYWIGKKIVIKEWNKEEDLPRLIKNVPTLGNALKSYYDDLGEERLFFVILQDNGREHLLATSSPMTGFVTPLDLESGDKQASKRMLSRRGSGYFFSGVKLLGERDADFKNYMYYLFGGEAKNLNDRFQEIRDYVRSFRDDPDIKHDYQPTATQTIYSNNSNPLVINSLEIKANTGSAAVNYFARNLIRVPYKIAPKKFRTFTLISPQGDERDYLLPLSKDGLLALSASKELKAEFKDVCGGVDVKLEYDGHIYKKSYRDSPSSVNGEGGILDLARDRINFDLAIFPNCLSSKNKENNYFEVLAMTGDGNNTKEFFADKNVRLDFFKEKNDAFAQIEQDDNADQCRAKEPVCRSKGGRCETKYYEIYNTCFDAILGTIYAGNKTCEFTLFPIWDKSDGSSSAFDYAVDFGTSNTYISRRKQGSNQQPEQLKVDKPIVSTLSNEKGSDQYSPLSRWQNGMPEEFLQTYKSEFVPQLIDGKVFKFPIRSALCHSGGRDDEYTLFANSNIAFHFEKGKNLPGQKVLTDIKWSGDREKISVFIRELLLLIKADILQENGDVSKTRIIWFRPLSLRASYKDLYYEIWKTEGKNILDIDESAIKCYTESEAPYHYYNKDGRYGQLESIAVVDIGGGSTDIIYYEKGEPSLTSSVHFGCDPLWGNGSSDISNSKENGIYKRYKDRVNPTIKELSDDMAADSERSTADIISFWIANDPNIKDFLSTDFKPLFAYHFTATIYYLASMLKTARKPYPKTITFSGNGSKYIDNYISTSTEVIEAIVKIIIGRVYDLKDISLSIQLPPERKEATCYGGLYHDDSHQAPTPLVYLGTGLNEGEMSIKELSDNYDKGGIKNRLHSELKEMNKCYFEVLRRLGKSFPDMTVKSEDIIKKAVEDPLEGLVGAKLLRTITSEYQNENAIYNDALFFIPIKDILLNLSNN